MHYRLTVCAGAMALAAAAPVHAQAPYPSKPVRIVVPLAAGGTVDIVARSLAQKLTETLGQQVIVENRPGVSSLVGTQYVSKAQPDGYTLLAIANTFATVPATMSSPGYDAVRDFAPITLTARIPQVLDVTPSLPVRTVKELIALAKSRPNQLSYASSGTGSTGHMAAELFNVQAGIKMLHVPYKGSAPALNDLITGRIDVMFDYPVSVGPHIEAGKLKVLATTAPARLKNMPNAPTMAELGLPDMTTESWSSIMVPAGTPPDIVDRLAAAAHTALTSDRVRTYFEKFGTRAMMQQKSEATPFIQKEIQRWADVIEKAGLEKQ
jgi:tripartite-type tricarboxylate transporter receptor subunit TctC